MTSMSGGVNIAARFKPKRLGFAFENQAGGPGEEEHPLGPILIIPFARWRRMTGGDGHSGIEVIDGGKVRVDERLVDERP
jgi:hypothetical protein